MSKTFDTIVIGAGSNGLAAATTLAAGGVSVCLVEREGALGGKSRSVEFAPGFHAAPLAIDPGWAPPEVAKALGIEELRRLPHDAPVSVVTGEGSFLTLWRDPARADEAIRKHSAVDAVAWPAFVARLRRLAGFLGELYRAPAPDVDLPAGELLSMIGVAQRFRGLGPADMIEFLRTLPMSVWELLDDCFKSDALKAAVAPSGVLDHAQGPRSGGTGFVLLHYLVGAPAGAVRGRAPWQGGASAFTRAAEAAARRAGVTIRAGASVARILVKDDAATGVALESGEEIAARRVLSTASPARTLLEWVDPVWIDPEVLHAVRNVRFRGCTSFAVYALDAPLSIPDLPAGALGGVVSLTPSVVALEKAADHAKYHEAPARPHVEITVPTVHDSGLAPTGKHVLIARAQYTAWRLRDGGAWDDARRAALGDSISKAISGVAPGFESHVLHREVWTPADLERRFGLSEGAPSHGELGLDQILFMRPISGLGRYASPIAGLYLGGAGSHPGPGVLGGAGWLAAKRILGDRVS